MAKKYDTNPLDPDFPRKVAEGQQTETLPNLSAETKSFNGSVVTEDPTRRYDNANYAQYYSAYTEPQQGGLYQTTRLDETEKPSNRRIKGVPENLLMILPYAPFYIGLVAGLLELLFVPQSETKVRFHAAQGLALHVAILAISTVLGIIGGFSRGARIGGILFGGAMMIFLIVSMVKIWKGKAVHFEFIDSLTNWLNEKIIIPTKQ